MNTKFHDRIVRLARAIKGTCEPELRHQPLCNENVLVVLNALATVSALAIAGTNGEARAFFDKALEEQLSELMAN
jgi:hypothetical protein